MASESRSHAPGREVSGDGVSQHKMMASGHGAMPGGNFGVGPLPGTRRIPHPEGPPSAKMLSDSERAGPPAFKISENHMHASHNPLHGPHHHSHAIHHPKKR
jgi:hypothetical protein